MSQSLRWAMTTGILLALWLVWNDAGNLALEQRRYADAAVAFQQAIAASDGATEPEAAMLWRNLSVAYSGEGMYRKAEDAASRSVRMLEVRFGPADPSLVPSLNALGESLAAEGRWMEARRVFERAVKLNLGGPHGATALHNLAAVSQMDGRLDKAVLLYQAALDQRRQIFGDTHALTLTTQRALEQISTLRQTSVAQK